MNYKIFLASLSLVTSSICLYAADTDIATILETHTLYADKAAETAITAEATTHAAIIASKNAHTVEKKVRFNIKGAQPGDAHDYDDDRASVGATYDDFYYEREHESPVTDDLAAVFRTNADEARANRIKADAEADKITKK